MGDMGSMNFNQFKSMYFFGDAHQALEKLAAEQSSGTYELTGSAEGHKAVLDSLDKKSEKEYKKYLWESLLTECRNERKKEIVSQGITKAKCVSQLRQIYDDKRKVGFILGTILIVLSPITFMIPPLSLTLLFVGILFLIMGIWFTETIKKINNLDFHIKVDTCKGKDIKVSDSGDPPGRTEEKFLYFSGGKKFRIDHMHQGPALDWKSEETVYNEAAVGKQYYTFYIGKSSKIQYVILADGYKFAPGEFIHQDGKIYPVKK